MPCAVCVDVCISVDVCICEFISCGFNWLKTPVIFKPLISIKHRRIFRLYSQGSVGTVVIMETGFGVRESRSRSRLFKDCFYSGKCSIN